MYILAINLTLILFTKYIYAWLYDTLQRQWTKLNCFSSALYNFP